MLEIRGNIKTISMFIKFPISALAGYFIFDTRNFGLNSYCRAIADMSKLGDTANVDIFVNGVKTKEITKNQWCHITLIFTNICNGIKIFNWMNDNTYGVKDIEIEHIRIFNRAITNVEMTALRNEILYLS